MDDAVLRVNGEEISLPMIVGTEGEMAIDISTLRKQTGITTFDRGFGNTAETKSAITFINGEEGILRYRGYPIEQLATQADFLEVAWLLSNGELPNAEELATFTNDITSHSLVREDMKHLFEAFPHTAHPMQILASEVSAMASYYPDALDPFDPESVQISTTRLISKVITMAAWSYKYRVHQPYVYPRNDLDYSSRFLHMMFSVPAEEYEPDPVVAQAMNTLFILHADHEQNCSASTVRIVGSGHANLFSSVASGINALSGPLHGGANQSVVEMLAKMVEQPGDVHQWIARAKDKDDGFRLMGFGHRVYRNFDPRARIIKQVAQDVLEKLGRNDPLLDMAMELESLVSEDDYFVSRKLYPNVDFYSGIIYRALGFPTDMFTVLFAIGRMPGWIAQWREMHGDPTTRIGRPRQIYTGANSRDYPSS